MSIFEQMRSTFEQQSIEMPNLYFKTGEDEEED